MLFTCPPCYTRVSQLLGQQQSQLQLPSEEKLQSRVFQKRASCARRQTGRWGGLLLFIIVPTNAAEDRRRCPRKGHSPGRTHVHERSHVHVHLRRPDASIVSIWSFDFCYCFSTLASSALQVCWEESVCLSVCELIFQFSTCFSCVLFFVVVRNCSPFSLFWGGNLSAFCLDELDCGNDT